MTVSGVSCTVTTVSTAGGEACDLPENSNSRATSATINTDQNKAPRSARLSGASAGKARCASMEGGALISGTRWIPFARLRGAGHEPVPKGMAWCCGISYSGEVLATGNSAALTEKYVFSLEIGTRLAKIFAEPQRRPFTVSGRAIQSVEAGPLATPERPSTKYLPRPADPLLSVLYLGQSALLLKDHARSAARGTEPGVPGLPGPPSAPPASRLLPAQFPPASAGVPAGAWSRHRLRTALPKRRPAPAMRPII